MKFLWWLTDQSEVVAKFGLVKNNLELSLLALPFIIQSVILGMARLFRGNIYELILNHISDTICWSGLESRVLLCSSVWEVVYNTYWDTTITICDGIAILV